MTSAGQLSVRAYGNQHGSHTHPFFQVLIGLDGTLELEVDGRGNRIAAGDGWVVPPGARHDFEARSGSRCLVLDSPDAAWSYCSATPRPGQPVQDLARYLADVVARQEGPAYSHALQFGPILLLEAWSGPGTKPGPGSRRIDWQALSAWAVTRWHDSTLRVEDLATQAYLSSTQFSTRCRQETGLSPMQWLRLQRLAHARQLQAQGLGVAESARRSGYRSPSALTAAMRRVDGH